MWPFLGNVVSYPSSPCSMRRSARRQVPESDESSFCGTAAMPIAKVRLPVYNGTMLPLGVKLRLPAEFSKVDMGAKALSS